MEKNIEMKVKNSDGSFDTLFPVTKESNVSGAIQNLAPHGYRKLPNGLILQWGAMTAGSWGASVVQELNVTFPITFPNQVFHAICSPHNNTNTSGIAQVWTARSYTKTGFTAVAHMPAKLAMDVRWFAIGY